MSTFYFVAFSVWQCDYAYPSLKYSILILFHTQYLTLWTCISILILSVSSLKFYSFNILILVFDIVDIPSPSFCAFRYSKTLHFVVWILQLTLWIILPLLSVSSLSFCSVVFSIWHCGAVRSRLQGERRRAGHPDPSRPGESVRPDRRGNCDLILLIVT